MSDFIFKKMTGFGFSGDDAVEIIKVLKNYVSFYRRNWKKELLCDWRRASYQYVTELQADLLQAVRNSWEASNFVRKLTATKIKAETI